ncbi:SRPBCC domain-containing protein [Paraflavitalea sp. CAU 1676]|uniref:SRPBCC family protein n=1 Tax=Paraflavitalea sp. CAU 1676 TaxID=3032598 RepID=UPI0023DCCD16|nr:SRPBCC domain-containing protein [Paraflavitalea sp. CAU 1676]MDF2193479.1 SRPBCC domain-containing protein [Paraflavitalea sp. CAU 1676]
MTNIRHNVVIKAPADAVYRAITTQQGIEAWWCKQTTAKPELGFTNVFIFGDIRNEMKVTALSPNKRTEWDCEKSIEEWIGTTIAFELEDRQDKTLVRFTHDGWREVTDTFAGCNYQWALFMKSLKSYCETGQGTPS